MSQDEGKQENEGGAAGGQGSGGGSSRADWQADLAARLAEQRARRQAQRQRLAGAAGGDGEEEDEAAPEAPTALESAQTSVQAFTETTRQAMAPVRDAQAEWAEIAGGVEGVLNAAATWFGEASSAITSFLAPVPAMLLMFLNYKVPIPIPIPVMYKPTTLAWSKTADWSAPIGDSSSNCSGKVAEQKTPLHNVPQATFKGGGPEELDLELFFDTTDTQMDVRFMTKPIQALVYIVPLRNEPPLVMFSWGMMLSKMSYVKKVDIEYTMFRADGTPLRAEVDLTLVEYDLGFLSALPMNPTSYSEARKTWVVTEGQTLDWIAYQEYGNSIHWRHIAQVNNLTNPRDLRSGQILKLTPLP